MFCFFDFKNYFIYEEFIFVFLYIEFYVIPILRNVIFCNASFEFHLCNINTIKSLATCILKVHIVHFSLIYCWFNYME